MGEVANRLREWNEADDYSDEIWQIIEEVNDVEFHAENNRIAKDQAYAERDKLVALLASIYPAWIARHPESDTMWDDDWRWIIFVKLPTGQASWHIHDSEYHMFAHLKVRDAKNQHVGSDWDGHTTEQKYVRVELAAEAARRGILGVKYDA